MNKVAKNNLIKILSSIMIVGVLFAATLCLSACAMPATLTSSVGDTVQNFALNSEQDVALGSITFEYKVAEDSSKDKSLTYADLKDNVSGFNTQTATEEGKTRVITVSYKGAVCIIRYTVG